MKCPECNCEKEDMARIRIELIEKKSKEIIEVVYGEILCINCLKKRYKNRTKLRLYV